MNNPMRSSVRVVAVLSMLCGCATIIGGTSQTMSFTSTPPEATVSIAGRVIGKTPITTQIKKDSGDAVTFEKDGYKPITMHMEQGLEDWFWGNILLGGLIGTTVDVASGGIHEYEQTSYLVTMEAAVTGPIDGKVVLPDRAKAKEFIVVAYPQIMKDLAAKKGQYLDSLFEMLKVPADQRTDAARKIEALAGVYSTIPEFADRVIELYLK